MVLGSISTFRLIMTLTDAAASSTSQPSSMSHTHSDDGADASRDFNKAASVSEFIEGNDFDELAFWRRIETSEEEIGVSRSVSLDYPPSESEMREGFDIFDNNNDVLIIPLNLRAYLRQFGIEMTDEEEDLMLSFTARSLRPHFMLSATHFWSVVSDALLAAMEADLLFGDDVDIVEDDSFFPAFHVFDKKPDDYITPHELQRVLFGLGLPEGKSLKSSK